jgi:hypothetical protein
LRSYQPLLRSARGEGASRQNASLLVFELHVCSVTDRTKNAVQLSLGLNNGNHLAGDWIDLPDWRRATLRAIEPIISPLEFSFGFGPISGLAFWCRLARARLSIKAC